MSNPIDFSKLFNFDDTQQLNNAIEVIKRLTSETGDYAEVIDALDKKLGELIETQKVVVQQAEFLSGKIKDKTGVLEQDNQAIIRNEEVTEALFKTQQQLNTDIEQVNKALKKTNEERERVTQNTEKLTKTQEEQVRLTKRLNDLTEENAKENAELRVQIQEKNKQLKEEARETLGLVRLYDRQSKELNELRKDYKDVALAQGESSTEARRLKRRIDQLDTSLKRVDGNAGQFQRNVGNYPQLFSRIAARVAVFTAGIVAAVRAVGEGIRIFRQYSDVNSTLRGILRANREETAQLREQQRLLGETTEFSASQVAQAQIEQARLGATQEEIIALTPDILSAATALGVDLAPAAELVVGQLNAFGLEAAEGGRVADVLSKATQISAFNFERLQTALGIVSPAAKAVNADLETTLGILSAAVDANIDASTAATALRNIFIDLGDQGITFSEALEQINNSTDKLNTANDLFGKRGAVVASVIAENTEKIQENTAALNDAAGTAEEFAEEQLDNLTGDIKLLTSAWEGFVLSIEDGDGAIARLIRGSLQALTSLLGALTPELEKQTSALEVQRQEFLALTTILTDLNPTQEERARIINRLNTEFGEYLPNLLTEKTSNEELLAVQKQVNDQLLLRIVLTERQEELNRIAEFQVNNAKEIIELQERQAENLREIESLQTASITGGTAQIQNINARIQAREQENEEIEQQIENLRVLGTAGSRISALVTQDFQRLQEELGLITGGTEEVKTGLDEVGKQGERTANSIEEIDKKTGDFIKSVRIAGGVIPSVFIEIGNQFDLTSSEVEKLAVTIEGVLIPKTNIAFLRISGFFQKFGQAVDAVFQGIDDTIQNSIDRINNRFDEELERLEENEERRLSILGLNEAAETAIRQRGEQQREQIEERRSARLRRAAIAQKALKVTEIITNTSAAIISALAPPPLGLGPVFGQPVAINAGIVGGIQLATALAAPIPQFATGTDNAPKGLAIVDEQGAEIIYNPRTKSVEVGSDKGPRLVDLEGGEVIFNAIVSKNLLDDTANQASKANESGFSTVISSPGFAQNKAILEAKRANDQNQEFLKFLVNRIENLPLTDWSVQFDELMKTIRKGNTIYEDVKGENPVSRI